MEINKRFGQIVKKFREDKHISQEVMSGLAGVDRSHLSKIELGLRSPTLTVLYKLAGALDVQASDILRAFEANERSVNKTYAD